MPSPVEIAQAAARRAQKTLAGKVVAIKRGADSVNKTAVVGNTRMEVASADGFVVQSKMRDYLIDAVDYDFGAGAVEPAEGDEIREVEGSVTYVYTVLPLGTEKAARWSDLSGKTWRIHTKLTSVE